MLYETQFSNLFIDEIWSWTPCSVPCYSSSCCCLSVILICELVQIHFWDLVNLMTSVWWLKGNYEDIAGLCFCNQSDVSNEDTGVLDFNVHFLPPHAVLKASSLLWAIWFNNHPEQLQLTWLVSIWCLLTTLNFGFFFCQMRIMKPASEGSCVDYITEQMRAYFSPWHAVQAH